MDLRRIVLIPGKQNQMPEARRLSRGINQSICPARHETIANRPRTRYRTSRYKFLPWSDGIVNADPHSSQRRRIAKIDNVPGHDMNTDHL
jgi:hypothetical protein